MQCPRCRLINPDIAARCDCGYDFESGTMQESYLVQDFRQRHPDAAAWLRERGRRDTKEGAICVALGGIVTAASYSFAPEWGAAYWVLCGTILYGLLLLGRGIRRLRLARAGVQWKEHRE